MRSGTVLLKPKTDQGRDYDSPPRTYRGPSCSAPRDCHTLPRSSKKNGPTMPLTDIAAQSVTLASAEAFLPPL